MRIVCNNFTGGEISPTLSARYDLARHSNALQCMENMLPCLHGGAARRAGMRYLAQLNSHSVLIPFSFNAEAEQNFIIILQDGQFLVANTAGLLPQYSTGQGTAAPYAAAHLEAISYAQVGDVLYLAHKSYPLHKIMRTGQAPEYDWSVQAVVLNSSLPAPALPAVSFSGSAGSYTLRYTVVAVDAQGKESLPSPAGECPTGRHPSDWVQGNSATITWAAVDGAVEYTLYREEAGYFGFIGTSKQCSFSDQNYEADIADTPREDWNPFAEGNNPSTVAFHQQRMVLAGTAHSPQALYLSRTGDFENFRKSRPLQDDDPIEYQLASGTIDAIKWAVSFGDLLVGTAGCEYRATGEGGVLTTRNVNISAQSYWGSAGLHPIIIGNSVLHVQRHGARVRDLYYSLEKDGYAGNDLAIMAPHLFEGHSLRQWAYQQSPASTIWIVRDDGVLLALTYMKEHDIWGWSQHKTQGKVLSVASISGAERDEIILVVQRTLQGAEQIFLERLAPPWEDKTSIEDAFFVDCGLSAFQEQATCQHTGFAHLAGAAVAVLADGSPVEGLHIAADGSLTLPYAARQVTVGLGYSSVLSPLPPDGETGQGATLGLLRGCGRCLVRLHRSVGGKYGAHKDTLFDFPFVPERWGEPCAPYSGDIDCLPGGGQEAQASLWLVQDRPLPFHVMGIVMDMAFGERA
ncbi:MAG: hypothetical protein PHN64_06850 [Desulfovibrionaceae bacterium]|nr:hypothetical protein [Desulfovibrionaceae bacterium]